MKRDDFFNLQSAVSFTVLSVWLGRADLRQGWEEPLRGPGQTLAAVWASSWYISTGSCYKNQLAIKLIFCVSDQVRRQCWGELEHLLPNRNVLVAVSTDHTTVLVCRDGARVWVWYGAVGDGFCGSWEVNCGWAEFVVGRTRQHHKPCAQVRHQCTTRLHRRRYVHTAPHVMNCLESRGPGKQSHDRWWELLQSNVQFRLPKQVHCQSLATW